MGLLFFDKLRNQIDMKKAEAAVKRAERKDNKRFREERTFSERQITVSTRAELQDAVDKRYGVIIIAGEMAEHVSKAYKVKDKLALLENAPHPTSMGFLASVGVTETVIITAIVALTVVLVVALLKNYSVDTDIQILDDKGNVEPKLKLKLVK